MYNILLVNEQDLMREALEKIIYNTKDFEKTCECVSYAEAVSICKSKNVDIIFVDLLTNVEDKIIFIKQIYKINPMIKIYFISCYNDFLIISKLLKEKKYLDIIDLILRPISKKIIIDSLENYKNNSRKLEDVMLEDIYEGIQESNFIKIYNYIPHLCKWLRNIKESGEDSISKMYYIGNCVINYDSVFTCKIKAEDLFPINKKNVVSNNLYCIWLFEVMDYYFRKKSIISYPILENVYKYIDKNIKENISLKDVVEKCNISQGYLSRIFKNEYNLTVLNYIHLKKISLSKLMFLNHNLSISEVSFNLGYKESSYFCKVFKKYEGKTVDEFKLENEKR